ncbi:hypothetical protein DVH05_017912 [Phytophthora capsici]|nr:hypothetical protein DVH05_017912 [Phytophthora capsici]
MVATQYRRIRLEETSKLSNEPTEAEMGEIAGDEAAGYALSNEENVETGEGGRPPEDDELRADNDDVRTGEGGTIPEPDGERRAVERRRITAERRQYRRAARRAARQRRRERLLTGQTVEGPEEKKHDGRAMKRRRQAEIAMQNLEERKNQRAMESAVNENVEREHSATVKLVKQVRGCGEAIPMTNQDDEERVRSADGLPTASMRIDRAWRDVKLDSCARYSVAGTEWMQFGDKLDIEAPVDYVEGIRGFLLDVVGVWRFQFRTVFGVWMLVL